MKIDGLKVIKDMGWKAASQFTTDKGETLQIPAAHKVLCDDESGNSVQLQILSDKPVQLKVGGSLPPVTIASAVKRDSWSWSFKGTI